MISSWFIINIKLLQTHLRIALHLVGGGRDQAQFISREKLKCLCFVGFFPPTMAFKYFFSALCFPRLFFLLISTAHFSSMLDLVACGSAFTG